MRERVAKPRNRWGLAGGLAAALLLAGLLGLSPYIAGRKTSTRIASEYTGVVVSKPVRVSQSKYRRSLTYSLVIRSDDGRVLTVPVPLDLHHKARVGSHVRKSAGEALPALQ
jgi:hypothetical protein